jgi:UDP-3-O-[3-hydroxymyristoyl] glucosamine N-acyltransferase
MRLGNLSQHGITDVVRDGEFKTLGFVSHQGTAMLVFIESAKYLDALLSNPQVSCVITSEALAGSIPDRYGVAVAEGPRRAFYELHNSLTKETDFYWTSFPTAIAASAQIHPTAHVADHDVRIGERVLIEPNVTILERVIIEDDVIIRAGTVIGSEGFEFNLIDGEILPVLHGGGVRIGRRVEIQANCCVVRSVFGGFTEIGEDSKIDSLIHIGHNVSIGKRCRLAARAMIGGSVTIGDEVWIGPSVSISSEITIGDRASLTLGSVVTRDVLPGQRVTGNFAIDHDKFIAFLRTIR